LLQYGFDPASFVRYLSKLGTLQHIYLIQSELPDWSEFQAENCYLGLELDLQTEASKAEIESVFEFIQELAQIRILPPDSQVEDYLSLIAALPQDEDRLGEILVASGLLTANELARSLQKQTEQTPTAKIGDMLVQDGAVPAIAVDAALQKQQQIRDTSKDLGKEIQLQINGAETELDKTVVDKIADPLTHLVRNALDHGIETAEERLAAGKPAKGVLRLNAYHESECGDRGSG
jgi:two-component system chemotaxis sensor kinase CheA